MVTAVGRPRATSAAKLGPDSTANGRRRQHLGADLRHRLQRAGLDPLGAKQQRQPRRQHAAQALEHAAQELRRHDEQRRVGAGDRRVEVAGRGDRRVERDAGQIERVFVPLR